MKHFNNRYSQAFILSCSFTILLICHEQANAAPAAADLLQACEQSLHDGFQGMEGDLCTWYVTPCDCNYGTASDLPRVCLPDSVPVETLARKVIAGLREDPELQYQPADYAAAIILSRDYPCIE